MGYKLQNIWKAALTLVVTFIPLYGWSADSFTPNGKLLNYSLLDRALQDLVAMPGGPPGALVLIQQGWKRSVYRAGVADFKTGCPPRPDEHMRIASVSKAFSGAAALTLVADGVLRLDDTIGQLLPDLPVIWHPVSLGEVLNHTSGLPDYSGSPAFRERILAEPANAPPPRDLLTFVADRPLLFNPGSAYHYSNSDNIVVALMIEAATGLNYAQALHDQVMQPLQLDQSDFPDGTELPQPFIHGYQLDDFGLFDDVSEIIAFGGYAWASGGIVSTPNNLGRFVRGYIGGKLFGLKKWVRKIDFVENANSEPPGPGTNAAGIGFFRYQTRCGTVYGHTGSILGYTQLIATTDDGKTSIVFSVNTQIDETALPSLRNAQELAVCAALWGNFPRLIQNDKASRKVNVKNIIHTFSERSSDFFRKLRN